MAKPLTNRQLVERIRHQLYWVNRSLAVPAGGAWLSAQLCQAAQGWQALQQSWGTDG